MTMDYESDRTRKPVTEQEGVLFASTPVWERGRKRRGLAGRKTLSRAPETTAAADRASTVAAEPRSFAPRAEPLDRPTAAEPADQGIVAPVTRPSTASRTRRRGLSGGAMMALAVGIVAVGAVAAGGWYLAQDREGVPVLTPGETPVQTAAATPAAPAGTLPPAPPQELAMNQAAPPPVNPTPRESAPAPARHATSTPRAHATPRASTAEDNSANASATVRDLPQQPLPYSELNPGAPVPSAATANPTPPAPAPVNPAPTETAPQSIPQTPPVLPESPPQTATSPEAGATAPELTPPTSD